MNQTNYDIRNMDYWTVIRAGYQLLDLFECERRDIRLRFSGEILQLSAYDGAESLNRYTDNDLYVDAMVVIALLSAEVLEVAVGALGVRVHAEDHKVSIFSEDPKFLVKAGRAFERLVCMSEPSAAITATLLECKARLEDCEQGNTSCM